MGAMGMSASRSVKWALVGTCLTFAGLAGAQETGGYPQRAYSDPRGASKSQTYPQAPANPRGSPSTWTSRPPVQQSYPPRTAPERPAYPSSPGYSSGYSNQQPRAQTYVLAPPVLPHREGVETPAGYVLMTHPNHGLMIGGGLTWGGAYAAGLVYAVSNSFDNGTGWLAAPLVGPWGAISSRRFKCKSSQNVTQKEIDKCVDGALGEVTSITFLAMVGLLQAVGTTLFFVGVGDKTHEWVRADLADVKVRADARQVGDSGYGLVLDGSF